MKITKIVLDGKKNGIVVELPTNKPYRKFVNVMDEKTQKRVPRLFTNYETAKIVSKNIKTDGKGKLKYFFMLDLPYSKKEPVLIPIEKSQKIYGKYEIYISEEVFGEKVRLVIEERKSHHVMEIGYLVFDNGDTVRSNKAESIYRQRDIFNGMCQAFSNILFENKLNISQIKKKSRREIVIKFKNSTTEIHILTNSQLMYFNQRRVEKKERVLPFVKSMDKFTTFYVYIKRDILEPKHINGTANAKLVLNKFMEIIQSMVDENDPKPKYVNTEFSGYITL